MIHTECCNLLAREMAREIEECALWSASKQTCLRKAVGVSIVSPREDGTFSAVTRAHNGPSANGYQCTNIVGNCGCSHSEPRAIMQALNLGWYRSPHQRLVLLATYSPCTNCANVINDADIITAVVYKTLTEHDKRGAELLTKAGTPALTIEDLLAGKHNDIVRQWR